MNTKEPTPNHICGTPDAMCDTDCMGAAGSWPMCDADIDRMERAAIAIETLTANLDALIEANKKLVEALDACLPFIDDAGDIAQFYPDSSATNACRKAVADARTLLASVRK